MTATQDLKAIKTRLLLKYIQIFKPHKYIKKMYNLLSEDSVAIDFNPTLDSKLWKPQLQSMCSILILQKSLLTIFSKTETSLTTEYL